MGKSKRRANVVEETTANEVDEAPPLPKPIRARTCRACRRPFYDPTQKSRVEEALTIGEADLVYILQLHSYAPDGTLPPFTEAFLTFLCPGEPRPSQTRMNDMIEKVSLFGYANPLASALLVQHFGKERSLRDIASELGSNHTSLGRHLKHIREVLLKDLREKAA